jgi:hypothetical protein
MDDRAHAMGKRLASIAEVAKRKVNAPMAGMLLDTERYRLVKQKNS